MKTTLELYGAQTGNCIRAAIALEEAGLSYTPKLVDLSSGAHRVSSHQLLDHRQEQLRGIGLCEPPDWIHRAELRAKARGHIREGPSSSGLEIAPEGTTIVDCAESLMAKGAFG
jgi:hypothetical protein